VNLVTPEQAAHWYTREGLPLYTVAKKDGTPRNTTLADARKLNLVPSVTGILSVIAKPALDAWKQEQAIMSALTLPCLPDESDEDFARRVVKDSKEQVGRAADKGTEVHAFCESWLLAYYDDERAKTVLPGGLETVCINWTRWANKTLGLGQFTVEEAFSSPLGYGGRCDFSGFDIMYNTAVFDWKTQFVKTGKEPVFYETWDLQLAAYAAAVNPGARRYSVVISTNPENPVVKCHQWEGDSFHVFLSALEIWKYLNSFDPSFGGNE
jgi:hypothetical protein